MTVIYIIYLFLFLQVSTIESKPKKTLGGKLTAFTYYFNPEYFNGSIIVIKDGVNTLFNGGLYILKRIDSFYSNFNIQLKLPNSQKYQTIIKITNLDICAFFNGSSKDTMVKLIHEEFKKYTDFPTSCPLQPNFYRLWNFKFDGSKVAPMMVPGNYKAILYSHSKTKDSMALLYNATFFGVITLK